MTASEYGRGLFVGGSDRRDSPGSTRTDRACQVVGPWILPAGFEPASRGRKPRMIGLATTLRKHGVGSDR